MHYTEAFSVSAMADSPPPSVNSGALVSLEELLHSSSLFFSDGSSLRVTGKLEDYTVDTAIAVIADGNATLKINTEHLQDISFRTDSMYQFIGELSIQPDNEPILQARVGRNVDGLDLELYRQAVGLVRQFQDERKDNQMVE